MVPSWFVPSMSRDQAEYKLSTQNTGNFLIRQSSQTGSLALSVNTGQRGGEISVQHFIVNSRDGCVALEDSELEFDSLVSLVTYYTSHREELPVALKLFTHQRKSSAPVGIRRGDSPYVSMVGKQRTKSTIWINSPAFRPSDSTSTLEKDLEVIKSVLEQNSSLDLDSLEKDKSNAKEDHTTKHNSETDAIERITEDKSNEEADTCQVTTKLTQETEYEDYSLPIDIQNTNNIYEDPDIVRSNRVQNCITPPAVKISNSPSSPSLPQNDSSYTSLPVEVNLTSDVKPMNHMRQPLEPFQPLRKLSSSHHNFSRYNRKVETKNQDTVGAMITRSAEYRPKFRKNNSVIHPPPFRSLDTKLGSSNMSKSCSDLFKDLERKNGQQPELRKSFVRKVSLNLSVRKSNSKPIRKISDAMKKIFPSPIKSLKSLANSQVNSDSWEYLAECGVNPVYEEVSETKENNPMQKPANRCMSCDSLYESDNSAASSMSRGCTDISVLTRGCPPDLSSKQKSAYGPPSDEQKKSKPRSQANYRVQSKNVGNSVDKVLFV